MSSSSLDIIDNNPEEGQDQMFVETSPCERFERYNEVIGLGPFKVIYRGFDKDSGSEVSWSWVRWNMVDPQTRRAILNEMTTFQTLKHRNVVSYLGAWINQTNDEVIFISEIVSGCNLKEYLNKIKSPFLVVIKRWCRGILEGLAYLHSIQPRPIIHRQLWLESIYINCCNGECSIGDLGLKSFSQTMTSSIPITPEYIAPEVFDEVHTPKQDIYSFGICLLEIWVRRTPYKECKSLMQIYKTVLSGKLPSDIARIPDPEMDSFITRCLQPLDKRATALELLDAVWLQDNSDPNNSKPITLLPEPPIETVPKCKAPELEWADSSCDLLHLYTNESTHDITQHSWSVDGAIYHIHLTINNDGKKTDVKFDFDSLHDNVPKVSEDLIEALNLPPTSLQSIQSEIHHLIAECKSQNGQRVEMNPPNRTSIEALDLLSQTEEEIRQHSLVSRLDLRKQNLERLTSLHVDSSFDLSQRSLMDSKSPFSSGNMSPIQHQGKHR